MTPSKEINQSWERVGEERSPLCMLPIRLRKANTKIDPVFELTVSDAKFGTGCRLTWRFAKQKLQGPAVELKSLSMCLHAAIGRS